MKNKISFFRILFIFLPLFFVGQVHAHTENFSVINDPNEKEWWRGFDHAVVSGGVYRITISKKDINDDSDPDLYIKLGSDPTSSSYDKKSDSSGSTETINYTATNSGKLEIGVFCYTGDGEWFDNDCEFTGRFTVISEPVTKPDLKVAYFYAPNSITKGGCIKVRYKISNIGNANAGSSKLNFHWSSNTTVGGSDEKADIESNSCNYDNDYDNDVSINSISASGHIEGESYINVPNDLSDSFDNLVSYIDLDDDIDESNENNNSNHETLSLISPDNTKPSVSLISPADGTRTTNRRPVFRWTGSDSQSGIDYYNIDIDDSGSGKRLYERVSSPWTPPRDLSYGDVDWDVTAYDKAGNFRETSEWDLDIERIATNPDLRIRASDIQIRAKTGSTIEVGEDFDIYTTIYNIGTESSGYFHVRYYYGGSSSSNFTSFDTDANYGINAGRNDDEYSDNKVAIVSGTNYVKVCVYDTDSDDPSSNDCAIKSFYVRVAPKPDLDVIAFSLSKTSANSGDRITVNYTVKNIGNASSGSISNRIYLSTNSNIISGTPLNTDSMGSFSINETNNEISYITLPSKPSGTYYIGVVVDYNNQISNESNENNNTAYDSIQITAPNQAPSKPGAISKTNATKNSISISWGASSDPDGDVSRYYIEYTNNTIDSWHSCGNTANTGYTCDGLSSGEDYKFRVKAKDKDNADSPWRESSYYDSLYGTTLSVSHTPYYAVAGKGVIRFNLDLDCKTYAGVSTCPLLNLNKNISLKFNNIIKSCTGNNNGNCFIEFNTPDTPKDSQVGGYTVVATFSGDSRFERATAQEVAYVILEPDLLIDNTYISSTKDDIDNNKNGDVFVRNLVHLKFDVINSGGDISKNFKYTITISGFSNPIKGVVTSDEISGGKFTVHRDIVFPKPGSSQIDIQMDSESKIKESNENNNSKTISVNVLKNPDDPIKGTTIITHGYTIIDPLPWMKEMATFIRDRSGPSVVRLYKKETGEFDRLEEESTCPTPQNNNCEQILLFDWRLDSNDNGGGFSEAAAEALVASLMQSEKDNTFLLDHLHFIGHSRGTVVNSEAVERLLVIGKKVEQVTTLDPHDWGAAGLGEDHDVNPTLDSISYPPLNKRDKPGVVSWVGTNFDDNYFQHGNIVGLDGRAIAGVSVEKDLAKIGHAAVHNWYLGTINPLADVDKDLYIDTNTERDDETYGYHVSRIGSGRAVVGSSRSGQIFPKFSFNGSDNLGHGIVNGDFERSKSSETDIKNVAGWEYHGGGGSANVAGGKLEFSSADYKAIHNRIYIPNNTDNIHFNLEITDGSSNDKLVVKICNETKNININNISDTVQSISLANVKGKICTIEFELTAPGLTNIIDANINIDNIRFVSDLYKTLNVAKANFGTIATSDGGINCGSDCNQAYALGSNVQLTATPSTGYKFTNWSGNNCSGGDNPLTITMNNNKICTANFIAIVVEPTKYNLTTSTTNGSITSKPSGINCGSVCGATYNTGTSVELTVTSNDGYQFTGWSGANCSGSANPLTLTMTSDKTCSANFSLMPITSTIHTLSVSTTNGSINSNPSGINCGSECSAVFNENTSVSLSATANSGYEFTSWGGSCLGNTTPLTVVMTSDKTCSANFALSDITPNKPNKPLATDGEYDNKVKITWALDTDVDYYNLYTCTSSVTSTCGRVYRGTSNFYDYPNHSNVIYYRIKACNDYGCSEYSDYDTGYKKPTALLPPNNIQYDSGNANVSLSWDSNSGITYKVYWHTSPNVSTNNYLGSQPTSTNSVNITNLTNDTQYYFVVTAIRDSEESAISTKVSVTPTNVIADAHFITTWETTSSEERIHINGLDEFNGETSNYNLDCGTDGAAGERTASDGGDSYCDYANAGIHTISISGDLLGFRAGRKLKSIVKWGNISWKTMDRIFERTGDFIIEGGAGIPDLSQVKSMKKMFYLSGFNQPINHWDVSSVTNMSGMFDETANFNQPLNDWNVSNVTDMGGMFEDATNFNQSLNNWNTEKVTNMRSMFKKATSFNQSLNSWNVTSVTNMESMFEGATNFNGLINNWNVSNVPVVSYIFRNSGFNQPLNNWNVSKFTDMSDMFYEATQFNQPLNNWNVSSVTNMENMFANATNFNGLINGWNVSNVTDMSYMFEEATQFNQPLNNWNVANVNAFRDFLKGAKLSTVNYDKLLIAWNKLSLIKGVEFHGGNSTYSQLAKSARDNLISSSGHQWTIADGNLTDVAYYNLVLSATNGKIQSNPIGINCGSECSAAFNENTSVSLSATANRGYEFTSWGGSCLGATTPLTVVMTSDKTCSANFTLSDIDLKVSSPTKYFITTTNGLFINWHSTTPTLETLGQSLEIKGSIGDDKVLVGLGTTVDATKMTSTSGNDAIYLIGNFANYTESHQGSQYTLTRTVYINHTNYQESVTFFASTGDTLYFADGAIDISPATLKIPNTSNFKDLKDIPLNPDKTTPNPLPDDLSTPQPTSSTKIFITDTNKTTIAPAVKGSFLEIKGSIGDDSVLVGVGTIVDATKMTSTSGNDAIYLTGNFADYPDKSNSGSQYTISRTIPIHNTTYTESVTFFTSTNDKLYFADGFINIDAATLRKDGIFQPLSSTMLNTITPVIRPFASTTTPTIKQFTVTQQNGTKGTLIPLTTHPITITAEILPLNATNLRYEWSSPYLLSTPQSTPSIHITTLNLTQGNTYPLTLRITNNNGTTARQIHLKIIPLQTPDSDTDTDADNILDKNEKGDTDGNNIPDHLELPHPVHKLSIGNNQYMHSPLGTKLSAGNIAMGTSSAKITPIDIKNHRTQNALTALQTDTYTPAHIYDYQVEWLPALGARTTITLKVAPILPKTTLRTYTPITNSWNNFQTDENNKYYTTTVPTNTPCPTSNTDWDTENTLTKNATCLKILIQDGGPNDTDTQKNGSINNPLSLSTPL